MSSSAQQTYGLIANQSQVVVVGVGEKVSIVASGNAVLTYLEGMGFAPGLVLPLKIGAQSFVAQAPGQFQVDCFSGSVQITQSGTGKNPSLGAAATQIIVSPSGDNTGATDTAAIQAALTAARVDYPNLLETGPTAAGNIVKLVPGVWSINDTLAIGSYTTLDAVGSVINMVASTPKLMLANWSYANGPVATNQSQLATGGSQNIYFTTTNNSDPIYAAVSAAFGGPAGGTKWGVSLQLPMQYTSYGFSNYDNASPATSGQFIATVASSTFNGNLCPIDTYPPFNQIPLSPAKCWYRDVNIRILGGVWNKGSNGSGSNGNKDHCWRFAFVDGLSGGGFSFLSQQPSGQKNLYAILMSAVTSVNFDGIWFGVNPNHAFYVPQRDPSWVRDGIHVIGPARDIRIANVFGSTGDDMCAITACDFNAIGDYHCGDVTNVLFENIISTFCAQALVKVVGAPGCNVTKVRARHLRGFTDRAVYIGDDLSNIATSGGTYDEIICEDMATENGVNATVPAVVLIGQGLGSVTLKGMRFVQASGTTANMIEVGDGSNTTVVADLRVEDFNIATRVNAPLAVKASATVSRLRTKGWSEPKTNLPLISNSGAVTEVQIDDKLTPVALTAQSAAIGATNYLTVPFTGLWRIHMDLVCTATGNAVTVTGNVITNNGTASLTQSTSALNVNSLGAEVSSSFTALVAAGQTIQYSTSTSGGLGTSRYALRMRAEFVG